MLKLIFKLLSTILSWIIWAVSRVFDLLPFLPPGLGGLLVGGVVVCFVIGIVKFIRGDNMRNTLLLQLTGVRKLRLYYISVLMLLFGLLIGIGLPGLRRGNRRFFLQQHQATPPTTIYPSAATSRTPTTNTRAVLTPDWTTSKSNMTA
ncbi:MAG: hypothetical protein ACLS45_01790 [Subdoligranulum sp.]